MKENTVILTLERYHELQEKEKEADKPRAHTIYFGEPTLFGSRSIETDDDAVAKLADEINELNHEMSAKKEEQKKWLKALKEERSKLVEIKNRQRIFAIVLAISIVALTVVTKVLLTH